MNNFDIPLLSQVATLNGADLKASDSASNIIQAWLRAEGGTPMNSDTPNDLLRRLCLARGVTPQAGDSNSQLFQRMAGKPSGYSKWDCLQALLSSPRGSQIPRSLSITNLASTSFTLNWLPGVKTSPTVTSYKIDFSTSPDFSDFVIQDFSVSAPATHFDCTSFLPETNYYIRMRAHNASSQDSGYSDTLAFTTPAVPVPDPDPTAPTSAEGCVLWYSADSRVTLELDNTVSTIEDKSVSANHANWTTGTAPLYLTGGAGGSPFIRFNGTSDFLEFSFFDVSEFTVFVMANITSHAGWAGPISNWDGAGNGFEILSGTGNAATFTPQLLVGATGGAEVANLKSDTDISLPMGLKLLSFSRAGVSAEGRLSGASLTLGGGTDGWSPYSTRLGCSYSFTGMDMYEVVVYNRAVDSAERLELEAYFQSKYGVI